MQIWFFFFLLSLLFLVTDFCSSFNRRVKVALLGLTLQAKHLMHIFPKALLKWQLFMSTGRNLINKTSPLCIYHFDSMLSLAQNLISFFMFLLLKLLRFSLYMQRRINIPYLSEPVKLYMCLLLVSSLKELMGDRCWILSNILIAPLKMFFFPTISLKAILMIQICSTLSRKDLLSFLLAWSISSLKFYKMVILKLLVFLVSGKYPSSTSVWIVGCL